jgi:small subunit ribosomal protein S16
MVKLRLSRYGKRIYPLYRIVATDSRSPRDGKCIEIVGRYNPNKNPVEVHLEKEKIQLWLTRGAQASETVYSILKKNGFYKHN